jgi:SAM-dependent methyltransferase
MSSLGDPREEQREAAPMNARRDAFIELFERDADPWRMKTRFYEARKRALTLACLPDARYRRGYEPGCANGELTAALATRCEALLASDGVPTAVAQARARVAGQPHVEVFEAWLPEGWPTGSFDLVVLSELGYFLNADEMHEVIEAVRYALAEGGTLVACHWRHEVQGHPLDAALVHRLLGEQLGMPAIVHHEEPDLLLDVWCTDARSVAERD